MKRYTTVEEAVSLAMKTFEANHIISDTECIRQRVYSWYSHSDVTDPEILAACAIEGWWWPAATYQDMLDAKEEWFPKNIYDEISIWEIESAQHDLSFWQ